MDSQRHTTGKRRGTHCIEGGLGPRSAQERKISPPPYSIPGPYSPYRVYMSTELFRSTRCFRDFLNDAKPKKTLVSDQTATCSLQPQENTQNHLKSSTIDLDASPLHLMPSSCSVVSSGLQIYRCLQQAFISWDKQIWSSVSGMGRLMEEQREGETGLICVYSIQYTVYCILYTVSTRGYKVLDKRRSSNCVLRFYTLHKYQYMKQ